jgi:peptide/nickel transport system substrate-binding protein
MRLIRRTSRNPSRAPLSGPALTRPGLTRIAGPGRFLSPATAFALLVPVTLAAACSSPATGPAGSSGSRGPANGGTITVGLQNAPDALDPTVASTLIGRTVFANMCEKLYDIGPQLNLVPQLAAALPRISPDGLTYTITIRSGIRFNDGTPLTAAAVKTTLDWYRTNPLSVRASELKQVTSEAVTGPLTIQLHLAKPFAPLTSILADRSGMVLSPAQLHKLGNDFAKDPVCVGPFEFTSRPSLDQIILGRSPYYYGRSAVHLSKVIFQVITDQSAMATDLESGQIQVADVIAPQDVAAVQGNSATRVVTNDSLGYQGIDINVGNVHGSLKAPGTASNPFAQHPALRQAFELSLNRDQINKVAFDGRYTPGCTPIPPGSPWAVQVTCPAQNIGQAKALVAASGVKTPIRVTLMLQNSPVELQVGQVIQAMARQAGFAVTLQPTEFTTALSRAAAGNFEMFQEGWSGRVDPDQNIFSFWYPGSGLNYSGADDPALNALLIQARTSTDTAARHALYDRIVQRIQADRDIIYLWHDKNILGLRKNVAGVGYYPDGLVRLVHAQIG